MEKFSLAGRTALIIGGNSGIGRAIVELFAAHDARIGMGQFERQAQAAEFVTALTANGAEVSAVESDVSSESSVTRAKAWCEDHLGAVDILVNCAGIGGDKAFADLTVAGWGRMIGVHLRGAFLIIPAFFADMVARKYGRINETASHLAYKGGAKSSPLLRRQIGRRRLRAGAQLRGNATRRHGRCPRARDRRDGYLGDSL